MTRQEKYHEFGLWTDERIGWMLHTAAARWSDREFIRFENARYTFGELNRWVTRTAHALCDEGVGPGDRVMLHLANCMDLIVLQLAAWRIGAITVPVIPIYRAHELKSIISETRPKVIASCYSLGTRQPYCEVDHIIEALAPQGNKRAWFSLGRCDEKGYRPAMKILVGAETHPQDWRAPVERPSVDDNVEAVGLPEPAAADDVCTILFTSGTTSLPKGALLSSRALTANIATWRLGLGLSSRDVAFSGAPLTHIGALFSALLVPLGVGARTALISGWNADRAVEIIAEERATFMAGAQVFLSDLIERYERGAGSEHRVKIFASGGAPTAPDLIERADKVGVFAMRVYGMTETAGTLTIAPFDAPLNARSRYDGRVALGAEIEAVDDDRNPVPYGEIGHLRVRTPQLMLKYTDARSTAEQLDEDGWFYPGDVGSISADGWLQVTGRTKDIINRGGEKFSALEIELALASCADVKAASVVGMPDPRLGECVAAFLVLREGVSWQGPERVLAHLESARLARPKFPVQWHVVDALPMSASGKIQKNKLLELASEKGPDAA